MEVIILQTCCLRVQGSRSHRYRHSRAWTWTDEVNMEQKLVMRQIFSLTFPRHIKPVLRIYCRSTSKEHGKSVSGSHFSLCVPYAAHLHTSHHVSHVSDFIVSSELIFFFFTLCCVLPPSRFIFSLSVRMYVVVSAHACLHVCGCLCVHAHLLTSRGGGPSSPQTNPPLSLKAVTLVQAGRRRQTGPAGKEEVEFTNVLLNKKFELCFF